MILARLIVSKQIIPWVTFWHLEKNNALNCLLKTGGNSAASHDEFVREKDEVTAEYLGTEDKLCETPLSWLNLTLNPRNSRPFLTFHVFLLKSLSIRNWQASAFCAVTYFQLWGSLILARHSPLHSWIQTHSRSPRTLFKTNRYVSVCNKQALHVERRLSFQVQLSILLFPLMAICNYFWRFQVWFRRSRQFRHVFRPIRTPQPEEF